MRTDTLLPAKAKRLLALSKNRTLFCERIGPVFGYIGPKNSEAVGFDISIRNIVDFMIEVARRYFRIELHGFGYRLLIRYRYPDYNRQRLSVICGKIPKYD